MLSLSLFLKSVKQIKLSIPISQILYCRQPPQSNNLSNLSSSNFIHNLPNLSNQPIHIFFITHGLYQIHLMFHSLCLFSSLLLFLYLLASPLQFHLMQLHFLHPHFLLSYLCTTKSQPSWPPLFFFFMESSLFSFKSTTQNPQNRIICQTMATSPPGRWSREARINTTCITSKERPPNPCIYHKLT